MMSRLICMIFVADLIACRLIFFMSAVVLTMQPRGCGMGPLRGCCKCDGACCS
jgi:hypothetical protein